MMRDRARNEGVSRTSASGRKRLHRAMSTAAKIVPCWICGDPADSGEHKRPEWLLPLPKTMSLTVLRNKGRALCATDSEGTGWQQIPRISPSIPPLGCHFLSLFVRE